MKARYVVVALACLVACGGRLAGTTAFTVPTDSGAPSYQGPDLGPCSGDEYQVISSDYCESLCTAETAYALCDGTSYAVCSCELPSGWTEVPGGGVGEDAGVGSSETGVGFEEAGVGSSDAGVGVEEASVADGPISVGPANPVEQLVPLTANATGLVSAYSGSPSNTVGVVGSWYVYGDGWGTEGYDGGTGAAGERGLCELVGGFPPSDCSTITSPLPPSPQFGFASPGYANGFPATGPIATQTFCLSGTAAQVLTQDGGTSPDYADIYGIGLGLDFNNVGGVKSAYDAPAHSVVGVQFMITSSGAFPPLRIELCSRCPSTASAGPR